MQHFIPRARLMAAAGMVALVAVGCAATNPPARTGAAPSMAATQVVTPPPPSPTPPALTATCRVSRATEKGSGAYGYGQYRSVKVTVTNNSGQPQQPSTPLTVIFYNSSGRQVFTAANGDTLNGHMYLPSTPIAPGQSEAFSEPAMVPAMVTACQVTA